MQEVASSLRKEELQYKINREVIKYIFIFLIDS